MRKSLAKVTNEVSHPSTECPYPQRWSCYDGYSTELEVLNFIESLVMMLKPNTIVETGTWYGFGTIHILNAILENGFGKLHTAEVDKNIADIATRNIEKEFNSSLINLPCLIHQVSGETLIQNVYGEIDFAFLDSGDGHTRAAELASLFPKLSKYGYVVIHDTGSTHQDWCNVVLAKVFELGMKVMKFPTPRGVMILTK